MLSRDPKHLASFLRRWMRERPGEPLSPGRIAVLAGHLEGLAERLEEWEANTTVAPLARLPDGAAAGNVVRLRRRPG